MYEQLKIATYTQQNELHAFILLYKHYIKYTWEIDNMIRDCFKFSS